MVLLLNTVVVTIVVNLCNVLPASREYTHVEINVVITSDRDRRQCISIPLLNNRLPGSPVQFLLKATSSRYSITAVPSRVTILDDGKKDDKKQQLTFRACMSFTACMTQGEAGLV